MNCSYCKTYFARIAEELYPKFGERIMAFWQDPNVWIRWVFSSLKLWRACIMHMPESIWKIQLRTSARRTSQYRGPSYRSRKYSIFLHQHIWTKVGHRHCLRVELIEMRKATVSSRSMSKGFQRPGVEPWEPQRHRKLFPFSRKIPTIILPTSVAVHSELSTK